MGEGISRRHFAVLAGGTAVLSACGKGSSGGSNGSEFAATQADPALVKTTLDESFGIGLFGDSCVMPAGSKDPHGAAPNNWDAFAPDYIHIIHIESPEPWQFRVNQAHFLVKSGVIDNAGRLSQCVEILEERLELLKTKPESRFYDLQKFKPVKRVKDGEWADYPNADNFGYANQHQIFIFIQGGALTFNPRKLISFSSQRRDSLPGESNNSFFNAMLLDKEDSNTNLNIGAKLAAAGRVIRLDNYLTKPNGKKLNSLSEKITYSLNFHYGQPTIGGRSVPMIFDPNTGNGAGNEP